jgi:long-chain acyl-CoA synthetase
MDAVRVFERAVARGPERIFAFDRETAVTYEQAYEQVGAFARGYVDAGLSPGDTLGLCAPDSVPLLLAIIGAWKAGLLPGLIDARTDDASLPYFIEDVGAKLILAPEGSADRLMTAGANSVQTLEELPVRGGSVENMHDSDAPLYLSYTSGTTGAPKGAILRSGPVTLGTACIADRLGIDGDDVLLATTPTASSFQLVAALLPALHVGASVGLVAGRPIDEIWTIAKDRRATVLVAYPLTLADIVNAPDAGSAHPLRLALSGGSPLAPRIKRDYREKLGIPLLESYGQSELGGFMALGRPDDDARSLAGYVGRPLPDRPAQIGGVGADELPAGQVGEVVVPWGYFAGYRNKPEATERSMAGGVLHTGDLGLADSDGYLKILGRTIEAEAAVERGGFLRELEDAYYEQPSVQHAAVVAAADDGHVEAFVELRSGAQVEAEDLARTACQDVAPGLHPRRTTILEGMPRSFSGKADRMTLARRSEG